MLDRRSLLTSLCWMAASLAFAAEAPPEFESYERESGGRIGVYAESAARTAQRRDAAMFGEFAMDGGLLQGDASDGCHVIAEGTTFFTFRTLDWHELPVAAPT